MRIHCLGRSDKTYSCNPYLIVGSWNTPQDINTLVDTGTDGSIIDQIERINTGAGKKPVELVVLTHNHFDHSGGLKEIKERYNPKVCAFSYADGVDEQLIDGQVITMGDKKFEVIHTPGHSKDSVCFYCEKDKVLLSGDMPLRVTTMGGSYSVEFINALENISRRNISTIYPGHDAPIKQKVTEMVRMTLANVKSSGLMGWF